VQSRVHRQDPERLARLAGISVTQDQFHCNGAWAAIAVGNDEFNCPEHDKSISEPKFWRASMDIGVSLSS